MKRINYTIIIGLVFICFPFFMSYGQGNRYTGSYTKSPAIQHVGKSNFVIEGLDISNTNGDAISLHDCENVIIRYNKFSSTAKKGVYLYNCKNVTIIDNTFENVQSGLVASRSQGVKFEYNDVTNVLGRLKGANDVGVMAQLVEVYGAGNSISYNVNENLAGQSSTEDIINIYSSNGTPQSPIIVKGNWIRGGGPSNSGGGINLGDMSGSNQIAEDNILVNPGQYGIAISGGQNMTLRNNKVYGARQSFTNVGIVAVNWYENLGTANNITVANNTINYTHKDGYVNNWWIYQNVEPVINKETNRYDSNMTASILPDQIIGRARAGSPSNPGDGTPGGGSTPLPDEGDNEPEPEEQPQQPDPGESDKEPETPGIELPEINNHPSITIYMDRYDRVCVNIRGRLNKAEVIGANGSGEIIYQQSLTRFHTVLPGRAVPGTYYVYVKNGDKEHLKTFHIR